MYLSRNHSPTRSGSSTSASEAARDGVIDHPVVEAVHQHRLVGDGKLLDAFNLIWQITIELSVVRRTGPSMGNHVGKTGTLALGDRIGALLACAPRVPDQA